MLALASTTMLALVEPPLPSRPAVNSGVCAAPQLASVAIDRRAFVGGAAVAALAGLPEASFAESTLVTRQQAYTRYVPRIERGRDYWAGGLRKQIGTSDWASIKAALVPSAKKNAGGAIANVFSPMSLWASSFSSKVISDKTIAMNAAIDELAEAAASLELAANGKEKDGGLFGFLGGTKTLDDGARSALAKKAYAKGVSAYNKYIEIGNDGLGTNFNPLDTID